MYLMSLRVARHGLKYNLTQFADLKFIPIRRLFTREELGVTQFEGFRQNVIVNFKSPEQIEEHKKNFIKDFDNLQLAEKRNQLKQYILLIDNANELNTLKTLLLEYYNAYNNSVHNVKEYVFGTTIMRLLYILNLPDEAIQMFNDSDLRTVFEQMQTYKVFLTLLYEHKRYAEVFDLYQQIRTRLELFELFPDITINCLAFATCYHLNTPKHFAYAQELWKRAQNVKQLNRSRYFLAGLALKQNNPKCALGLVRAPSRYVTVRFLQIMAYTQLGYFDEANEVLRRSIANFKHDINGNKPYFGKQMIEGLRQAIEESGTTDHVSEFKKIHAELISLDLINNETLDERLCATFPPMLPKNLYHKMKNKTMKINN